VLTVVVTAKRPVPGRVKTRLAPPLTLRAAAAVAAAALQDTLDAVDALAPWPRVLSFDGAADDWLRPGWTLFRQPTGGLDKRLAAALHATGHRPALLVGMDTPQLSAAQVRSFAPDRYDTCLGPAADGGYWAIGFADPRRHAAAALHGVPMSTEHTGEVQLRRLRALGLRVQLLDELVDVDTIASARTVAAQAPDSAFAATLHAVDDEALVRR
jgi:glycosyltransferase A (GT-A) superfamily protein (DUF2064 family)